MPTPISSSSGYCTAAQSAAYFDTREINQLISDTGTAADYLTSDVWSELLQAASGEVESACFVGARYAVADLEALTNNSAALLQKLVAGIAFRSARQRRGRAGEQEPNLVVWADQMLKDLREGVRIFGLQEVADANQIEAQDNDLAFKETQNGVVFQSSRYFGPRAVDMR